ncbi:hypothetical protein (plasmid) [Erwinia amylovora ATCC 49946]|nr:hypothetical protein [Erwinia amylovora ATCC 49946]
MKCCLFLLPHRAKVMTKGRLASGYCTGGWGDQTDLNLYIFSRMERVRLCNRVEFDFLAIKIKNECDKYI